MKIVLTLLLLSVTALGDQPSNHEQSKPAMIFLTSGIGLVITTVFLLLMEEKPLRGAPVSSD